MHHVVNLLILLSFNQVKDVETYLSLKEKFKLKEVFENELRTDVFKEYDIL